MKTTSCGVLIFNEHHQLLMAHATGQKHWDIPKGGAEPGESPREAALREVQEETGLVLEPDALEELGVMPYSSAKNLHLFRTRLHTAQYSLADCRCTSYFPHKHTGVMTPETDAFRWVSAADIPRLAAKSMTAVLRTLPGFEGMV